MRKFFKNISFLKPLTIGLSVAVIYFLIPSAYNLELALAFTGPGSGQQPGSGGGLMVASGTFLGVGVGAPIEKLHITGNVLQSGASDTFGAAGIFLGVDTGRYWSFRRTATGNNLAIDYYNGSWSNAITALNSSGYVGIATTSPGQALDVNGNIRTNGSILGTYSGTISALNVTGPAAFGYYNQSVYNYAFPGSVAIGTSTTSGLNNLLTVSTPTGGTTNLLNIQTTVGGSSPYLPQIIFTAPNRDITTGQIGGGNFASGIYGLTLTGGSGSSPHLVITSGGNVGIGTTGPIGTLQVSNGTAGSNLQAHVVNITGNNYVGGTIGIYDAAALAANTGGGINFGGFYSGTAFTEWARIRSNKDNGTSGQYGASLIFATRANVGSMTDQMTITSGGNVGIGTTTPATALSVVGGGTLGQSTEKVIISTGRLSFNRNQFTGVNSDPTTAGFDIWNNGGNATFETYNTGGTIVATPLTILNSGNVGIGNTSPNAKLQIGDSGFTSDNGFQVLNWDNTAQRGIGYGYSSFRSSIQGRSGAAGVNNDVLALNPWGGNVGIATTTPGYTLTVNGNIKVAGSLGNGVIFADGTVQTTAFSGGTQIINASYISQGIFGSNTSGSNNSYIFRPTNNGTAFFQVIATSTGDVVFNVDTSNERVGIGTASPGNPLHVMTNTANDQYQTVFENLNTGQTRVAVKNSGAQAQFEVDVVSTGVIQFQTGKTQYAGTSLNMYSGSFGLMNGNVGIGTASPGAKLDVSGNIWTSSAGSARNASYDIGGGQIAAGSSIYSYGPICTGNSLGNCTGSSGVVIGSVNANATNNIPNSGNVFFTSGNVGIGTASPYGPLHVTGIGWSDQTIAADSPTMPTSTPAGGLVLDGGYTNGQYRTRLVKIDRGSNLPLYVQQSLGTANSFSNIARFGTHANSTNMFEVFGNAQIDGQLVIASANQITWAANNASNNINLQGGTITSVSKLTATAIDPLYNIGGQNYATYVPDTIGYQVEMFGKGELTGGKFVIDFKQAPKASDAWLFWQTIHEGQDMKDISVMLTPEGAEANLWYVLNPINSQIIIHGNKNVVFSYHLVAPRYDTAKWPNVSPAAEKGTPLPER